VVSIDYGVAILPPIKKRKVSVNTKKKTATSTNIGTVIVEKTFTTNIENVVNENNNVAINVDDNNSNSNFISIDNIEDHKNVVEEEMVLDNNVVVDLVQ
jgi:hypothetical protein